ncbi:hypothetical protein CH06BL_21630 [Chromobacterium haemolyticum]|nr:hypothetical protein CH06BL_21630 [Chromobacterium haemolyticum]
MDKSTTPSQPKKGLSSHGRKLRSTINRSFRRIWRHLHYRFPKFVPTPYRKSLAHLFNRDTETNLETQVPTGEQLRQIALWGVEIFGPAEVDALYLALERLGWNDDRVFRWINEQRTYGSEGSFNLGLIVRSGENRFHFKEHVAPLPESVDYAHGYIYQLSPSITAIIICFVLKEPAGHMYHDELSLDRRTLNIPLKDGYRSYNVEHIKRQAVDLARTRSRALIVDWFAAHLPGFFSSSPNGNHLPTSELISTNLEPLLVRHPEQKWAELLTPFASREVWTLKDCAGLSLCWPESDGDLRYHAIVNLQTSLLTADHLKIHGYFGIAAHASFVSDHIEGIMVNFAAIAALLETVRLLRLTPASISVDTKSRKSTIMRLEQIQMFFDRSVGIPALTSELTARSKNDFSYNHYCAAFQSIPWNEKEKSVEISEALSSRTRFLATRAQSLEKETREHLEQVSTILSTRENIRTQTRMELVAIGATIISLVSLVVAIMSTDKLTNYINQQIAKIYEIM